MAATATRDYGTLTDLERVAAEALAKARGYEGGLAEVDAVDDCEPRSVRQDARAVTKALLGAGATITAPTDLNALADALRDSIVNLEAHVEQRAQEIAAPRIAEAEQLARDRIADVRGEFESARQRWHDLEAELRRQLDFGTRQKANAWEESADALERALTAKPEVVRAWVDLYRQRAARIKTSA